MKVRVKQRPTGAFNGAEWPKVGEIVDLPDHIAIGMLNAGQVEAVKESKAETATPKAENVETADKPTTARRKR